MPSSPMENIGIESVIRKTEIARYNGSGHVLDFNAILKWNVIDRIFT